jgi:tRNA(fMet)-specific endonuclease VapC
MEIMKISLDTNAYTKLMQGHKTIADELEKAEELFLSAIVIGELLLGFSMGSRAKENARQFEDFIENEATIVTITRNMADRYAAIFKHLKTHGTPIPTNDIWIAAAAFETGSVLATYDTHFTLVPGLMVIAPE